MDQLKENKIWVLNGIFFLFEKKEAEDEEEEEEEKKSGIDQSRLTRLRI